MSKSINVGQSFTASVASTPAPAAGSVKATASGSGVSIRDNGDNSFFITGVLPNSATTITYSASGYQSTTESVTVNALPALVVTEGAAS